MITRIRVACHAIIFFCLIFSAGNVFSEPNDELSAVEVGFLYYKVSKLPIPWDHFANHYTEYRTARDEFQRMDVLAQVKPILEDQQKRVNSSNSFFARFKSELGEYDFKSSGFPTGISEGTFLPISAGRSNIKGPNFAIQFVNGRSFSLLPVDQKDAREKMVLLRESRAVRIEVEYEPQSATEELMNYDRLRVIKAKIKKIKIYSFKNDRLVGEVTN